MKITIGKASVKNIKTTVFKSDNLLEFYNFEKEEVGEKILIPQSLIEKLYNKQIKSLDDVPLCWEIIKIAKENEIGKYLDYNFNILLENEKINIKLGYRMKQIKHNLDEYIKYLINIEKYLELLEKDSESYIKFEI